MLSEIILAIPFPSWISDTAIPLPGPFSIKWYGLGYIAGLFFALYYTIRTCRKLSIWETDKPTSGPALIPNKRMLEDFMFFCLLGIMIGGRLGSVLLYDLGKYIKDPIAVFKVWEGGMAFHGGFLGLCVATIYMARSRKIPLMRLADLAAISAPMGILLVRLANFANQELYGRVTDVSWAVIFKGPSGAPLYPRHPSQLYEAFLEGFVILAVLWIASRKFKSMTRPGLSTGLFLLMYGTFRIFVENFREPDPIPQFGMLTRGMAYSLPMVIIGIVVIVWALRNKPVSPDHAPEEEGTKKSKKNTPRKNA